jgi:hypothetical protein
LLSENFTYLTFKNFICKLLPILIHNIDSRLREFDLTQYTEFLRDLGSLVSAFEKETTASGQRAILAKIQHGLIAAQDIGDDKLATVQVTPATIDGLPKGLFTQNRIFMLHSVVHSIRHSKD